MGRPKKTDEEKREAAIKSKQKKAQNRRIESQAIAALNSNNRIVAEAMNSNMQKRKAQNRSEVGDSIDHQETDKAVVSKRSRLQDVQNDNASYQVEHDVYTNQSNDIIQAEISEPSLQTDGNISIISDERDNTIIRADECDTATIQAECEKNTSDGAKNRANAELITARDVLGAKYDSELNVNLLEQLKASLNVTQSEIEDIINPQKWIMIDVLTLAILKLIGNSNLSIGCLSSSFFSEEVYLACNDVDKYIIVRPPRNCDLWVVPMFINENHFTLGVLKKTKIVAVYFCDSFHCKLSEKNKARLKEVAAHIYPGSTARVFESNQVDKQLDSTSCAAHTYCNAEDFLKTGKFAKKQENGAAKRQRLYNHLTASVGNVDSWVQGPQTLSHLSKLAKRVTMAEKRALETKSVRAARQATDRTLKKLARDNETQDERDIRATKRAATYQRRKKENFVTINLNEVETLYLGPMDAECSSCFGRHWRQEKVKGKITFMDCCNHGKVKIQMPKEHEYPHEFRELLTLQTAEAKEFRANIRTYNSLLAFGSSVTKEIRSKEGGPPTYRQLGEYHRKFNCSVQPNGGDTEAFGQLYVIDADVAQGIRMQKSSNVSSATLARIDALLRTKNKFAQAYTMMKEEEAKILADAETRGIETPSIKLLFSLKPGVDKNRYNMPRANEVAAVYVEGPDNETPPAYIAIRPKGRDLKTLHPLDKSVEPLIYPILHPTGKLGWDMNASKNKMSLLKYVKYLSAVRDESKSPFLPYLNAGRLTQQWFVDMFLRIDWSRQEYNRKQVNEFISTSYGALNEYLKCRAEELGAELGRKIILPSSYLGSPRYMSEAYDDAMAMVREFGKPDLFITMTCNPKWPEITENLLYGQSAADRPDLVARVFAIKYNALINFIKDSEIFGHVICHVGTIEFQKRGLPHVHLLFTLASDSKLTDAENIDRVISAELPDKVSEPELYEIITRNNMHQCKKYIKPSNRVMFFPCTADAESECTKKFPKAFREQTTHKEKGYAKYRRRDDGRVHISSDGQTLDNRHVVSFSPHLSKHLNCHINVEHVAAFEVIKYLHKYIFKGPDQAVIETEIVNTDGSKKKRLDYDEIKQYIQCRYLSAPEACWRLQENEIVNKSHCVERLDLHLENEHNIFLKADATEAEKEAKKQQKRSKLMAFFDYNNKHKTDELYCDMPKKYTWQYKDMIWTPRKGRYKTIGRIYSVSPQKSELFHLRLLLLKVRGPTSFSDLRTFDKTTYTTFKAACLARGLIDDNQEYIKAMEEAAAFKMPRQLRFMFAMLLIHCTPSDCAALYEEFKISLSEDKIRRYGEVDGINIAYNKIEAILMRNGTSFEALNMQPSLEYTEAQLHILENSVQNEEMLRKCRDLGEVLLSQCNADQRRIIDELMQQAENDELSAKCFFVDGSGGTGKTFLYSTLFNMLKGRGLNVCTLAFTGIAAIILPDGATIHSMFKFPLDVDQNTTSGVTKGSKQWQKLQKMSAFIIDEVSMVSASLLAAIDRTLRDVAQNNIPFGGKLMLIGGDFRQILPITTKVSPQHAYYACLKSSPLWKLFKRFALTQNMRAGNANASFATDILKIGNGELNNADDIIEIPKASIFQGNLIDEIFGAKINDENCSQIVKHIILATTNKEVDSINDDVLSIIDGDTKTYYSSDKIHEAETSKHKYMIELLTTLDEPNFPKHKLELKRNAIVMIVRNLDLKCGLCNGTRLRVLEMKQNVIQCQILTENKSGSIVFIPRIVLESTKNMPMAFYRKQFPLRHAFALTINKSQGQTFEKLGLKLDAKQVFTHGQLYVAVSRVSCWAKLRIKLASPIEYKCTNIVYKNVL